MSENSSSNAPQPNPMELYQMSNHSQGRLQSPEGHMHPMTAAAYQGHPSVPYPGHMQGLPPQSPQGHFQGYPIGHPMSGMPLPSVSHSQPGMSLGGMPTTPVKSQTPAMVPPNPFNNLHPAAVHGVPQQAYYQSNPVLP